MHIRLALISLATLSLLSLANPHGGAVAPEHSGNERPVETLPPPTTVTFVMPEEMHVPMQKVVDRCPLNLPDCADKTVVSD